MNSKFATLTNCEDGNIQYFGVAELSLHLIFFYSYFKYLNSSLFIKLTIIIRMTVGFKDIQPWCARNKRWRQQRQNPSYNSSQMLILHSNKTLLHRPHSSRHSIAHSARSVSILKVAQTRYCIHDTYRQSLRLHGFNWESC